MSNTVQLSSHLWQLKLGVVNSYLLETEDGLLLIDSGYPGSADKIFAAVRESGHDPLHIQHLFLTHCHIDHTGSAAEVRRRTGARTYAHVEDAPLIEQGIAERYGTTRTPGIVPFLVYQLFIKPAGTTCEPLPIDQHLQHGSTLSVAGDAQVIHAPGHSAGQVALLLKDEGILVAADICSHVMGLAYSTINEDRNLARRSILRVADYAFDQAAFGHGDVLREKANQQLKDKFSSN